MSVKSYSEIVLELESRGIMPERVPSLEPMKQGLQRFIPRLEIDPKKVVVVAGTNGKGSVCAGLEALLISAGEKVGLYTSPHLEETTERIRILGKDITKEQFCLAYQRVLEVTQDLFLSHFEMLTLMAVWLFFSGETTSSVDRAIFEVGLGGTWDATNAIPHQYCVITTLGYDHQNLLGFTLNEIAKNKFGIIQRKALVVHSPFPEEVKQLAMKTQAFTQSHWVESIPFQIDVTYQSRSPLFSIHTRWGSTPLALPGHRAGQNAATSLTLFHELGFSPENHLKALGEFKWPGRMERVLDNQTVCPVYLSGDHNPQGISSVIELLEYYPRKHLYLLVGIGKDKDREGILAPLFSLPDSSIFLTETPFRGTPVSSYGPWLTKAKMSGPNPLEVFRHILQTATPEDLILVTGSLYLVGFLRHELLKASHFSHSGQLGFSKISK